MKPDAATSISGIYFSSAGPSSHDNSNAINRLRCNFKGAQNVPPSPLSLRGGSDKKDDEKVGKDIQKNAWGRQSIYKKEPRTKDNKTSDDEKDKK